MPAKDLYHEAIKSALVKDGWIIVFDPYPIKYQEVDYLLIWLARKRFQPQRKKNKSLLRLKVFRAALLCVNFRQHWVNILFIRRFFLLPILNIKFIWRSQERFTRIFSLS